MTLVGEIESASQLLDRVETQIRRQGIIAPRDGGKFKELVLRQIQKYSLKKSVVKELADYLDIPFYDAPQKYRNWMPALCGNLKAVKYFNPSDSREYIAIVYRFINGTEVCLYHSPQGFQSVLWFADFIPLFDLAKGWHDFKKASNASSYVDLRNSPYRNQFTSHIGKEVNRLYPNLDPYAIRVVHGLFDVYLPNVDGICPNCFQAKFTRSGWGASYIHKPSAHDLLEIRISPEKPDGEAGQQRIYISSTVMINGQQIYIGWEPWKNQEPILRETPKYFDTHIPYNVFDKPSLDKLLSEKSMINQIKNFIGLKKQIILPICKC